jgi:hypothetical protein
MEMRSRTMKVDTIGAPRTATKTPDELPVIKPEEIKSILYLGLRGNVAAEAPGTHAIDMYA